MSERAPEPGPGFGVFAVDRELIVRTWDAWMAEMTGVAPEDALDKPLEVLLPDLAERGLLDLFRSTLASGTVEVLAPALHEYLVACPPRDPSSTLSRMRQRVSLGPIRDEGRITGVMVTVEDVTARVERDRDVGTRALAQVLGDASWRVRRDGVQTLARRGPGVVDALVQTIREQHRDFSVLSSALDLLALADIDVVQPFVDCLSGPDTDLRIQAALILGERRDGRAVPALLRALEDPDINVRFHAIESLGRLRAADAVEPLLALAEREDFFLAFPAIQALGALGDSSVAPRLVPLLADALLAPAIAEVLGEIGDDLAAEPLARVLGQPSVPVEIVADALAVLYHRYETRYGAGESIAETVRAAISPEGAEQLLEAVGRVSADRIAGLARVVGWLDGPAACGALARLLGQARARAQVVEALVRQGAVVVPALIDQLQAEDLETREAATVALGRIGDARATAPLAAALSDPDLAVPAAGALARIGDAAAYEPLMALLGHPDSATRQAAIGALNSIGHPDMPPRIAGMLQDRNPLVRESAVRIAGYFAYDGCLALVRRCGLDESEPVRRAAIDVLPLFDDSGTVAVVERALANDTASVRAAAVTALARVPFGEAVGPLTRALGDPDPWVRYFALRSLGHFGDPSVASAVAAHLDDRAGQVRVIAVETLGRLRPAGVLGLLEPLAASTERDMACAAIGAMGHVSDDRVHDVLETIARDGEFWRRMAAVAALGDVGGGRAIGALEWIAAADPEAEVAEAAVTALAVRATREDEHAGTAARALVAIVAEPARREAAVAALSRLPARRISDVAAGLRHASPAVRRAIVETLSRMRHTEATRMIETALDDDAPSVRMAAVDELRRLGSRMAARRLVIMARADQDREVRRHAAMSTWRTAASGQDAIHPAGGE